MPGKDPILSPELIKILKIFLFSSFGLVVIFSFFNSYRANNTDEDKTFKVLDSNRLFFLNVRSIQYDREYRKDAGMSLFRHKKRIIPDSVPSLYPALILNPKREEGYIYFELNQAEFPIQLKVLAGEDSLVIDFSGGNNEENYAFFRKLRPFWEQEGKFYLKTTNKEYPIWTDSKELDVLNTISEDYLRLLNQAN